MKKKKGAMIGMPLILGLIVQGQLGTKQQQ